MNSKFLVGLKKIAIEILNLLSKVHKEAGKITSSTFSKLYHGRCPGPDRIPMQIIMKDVTKR
jgi:hypothetical protein